MGRFSLCWLVLCKCWGWNCWSCVFSGYGVDTGFRIGTYWDDIWIGGSICYDIYLRWNVAQIRSIIVEHASEGLRSIEKDALLILKEIQDRKRVTGLRIFMQLSMISGNDSVRVDQANPFSNLELTMAFIKGISRQKSYQNVDLLILTSLIAACFGKEHVRALSLLKKYSIFSLHKALFKELLSESISVETMESINKQIAQLTMGCELTLKNLMTVNGNHKSVLRTYAKFLEEVKFDKDAASDIFEEASGIEEDEIN